MRLNSTYYIQTFESPDQLDYVFQTLKYAFGDSWDSGFDEIVVVDCSTKQDLINKNAEICEKNNAVHISDKINYGISGGRQRMAELFLKSDSEYAFQQGDGILWNPKNNAEVDPLGFTTYTPQFFTKAKKIMSYERLDYLLLTYMQKYASASWYYPWNHFSEEEKISSEYECHIRGKECPPTKFKHIKSIGKLPYAVGDIPYSNWPSVWSRRFASDLILSKHNGKATEWGWMRLLHYRKSNWNSAVVLTSPLKYYHKHDYDRKLRKENR